MPDTIKEIGNSVIQFGKHNDRVYIMKIDKSDMPSLITQVESLAKTDDYSKIFAKTPEHLKDEFLDRGYTQEAKIPNFYSSKTDVHFMSKFCKAQRGILTNKPNLEKVLEIAQQKKNEQQTKKLTDQFKLRRLTIKDCEQIASIYHRVFESYPFPIHDKNYIRKTMDENFIYYGVFCGKELAAVSSAEMDKKGSNAEMTDFATKPFFRGRSLASHLLTLMENDMRKLGIDTLYTIARAISAGMNITFSRAGYEFAGTLVNNTNISGSIESMNVWYKKLLPRHV